MSLRSQTSVASEASRNVVVVGNSQLNNTELTAQLSHAQTTSPAPIHHNISNNNKVSATVDTDLNASFESDSDGAFSDDNIFDDNSA